MHTIIRLSLYMCGLIFTDYELYKITGMQSLNNFYFLFFVLAFDLWLHISPRISADDVQPVLCGKSPEFTIN